ncbi:MAG: hypothetical protein M1837_005944 [Sclerophora amabilis]|nr:MAG: hypothetical protein M1837_005944 [Sclerophora amabilis]
MPLCPRIHFYEINDQSWLPPYIRQKVQSCLTLAWTLKLPLIQSLSPAQLVSSTLLRVLAGDVTKYTFVDFCAGAGGPTPTIERDLNRRLTRSSGVGGRERAADGKGEWKTDPGVQFLLTDIHPHLEAWEEAAKKSDHLGFIRESVDAANAPRDLIDAQGKKVFRLFNLAFHHFDDPLARQILKNTIETADGFGIFELQDRTVSSLLTIFIMGLLFVLITPIFFWRSPGHLLFHYIIPVIPVVLIFDGYISSLRTRSVDEVLGLLDGKAAQTAGWKFTSGSEMHTWPIGHMIWIVGVKQ